MYKINWKNECLNNWFLLFILVSFLITSCTGDPEIDTDQVNIDFRFNRFEQELFDSGASMNEKVTRFNTDYNTFFLRYCENVLRVGSPNSPAFEGNLNGFVSDPEIQTIYGKVQEEYANMDIEKVELEKALKRYHVYFPDNIVPWVVTLVSGFAYPVVVTDSILGIGLDMYMGTDFSYYDMMRVPLFRKNRMDRKFLVKDALKGWIQSEFITESSDKRFLHQIINQGKVLYAIQKTLPDLPEETIMGYSKKQWIWCEEHEKAMWGHFVNKKLFYSTQFSEYHKFINEGPFTAAFDRESPDQTGHYMGWKVVDAYMKNNPKVSLLELMKNEDSKQILALSGYKPEK
ncbi:MAG: hypothetical protein CL840_10155 [Crocinitomicaceae bacterium]|nr:hypothetical protein [Crocinitomicaceae bacterium]|tara:strand:+ start:1727 stop:2761 length:1035 start_codon:yes stop_codon:yes gene_type:complete